LSKCVSFDFKPALFVDAILSHESESVQDRVLSLEKKVQQQDDEIVCLKSALADALRRLAALEAGLSRSRCLYDV